MIVCLNKIRVKGSTEKYEAVYRQGSDFMAAQPGHIRHKLVRSTQDPDVYFSIAHWENLESYKALANIQELKDIFDQVNPEIELEHHECTVVYEGES